ncbi:hypothetical protein JCM31271_17910 [Halorubrum trueperi]
MPEQTPESHYAFSAVPRVKNAPSGVRRPADGPPRSEANRSQSPGSIDSFIAVVLDDPYGNSSHVSRPSLPTASDRGEEIECEAGTILRDVLAEASFSVYN